MKKFATLGALLVVFALGIAIGRASKPAPKFIDLTRMSPDAIARNEKSEREMNAEIKQIEREHEEWERKKSRGED